MPKDFQLMTTHKQEMLGEKARPNDLNATYPNQFLAPKSGDKCSCCDVFIVKGGAVDGFSKLCATISSNGK
jgi:uncharacterized protein (DUF2237 family)